MCVNCWTEAGSPAGWNQDIAEALRLTRILYAVYSTGGPMHSVLDDCNLDGTIEPYYDCFTSEELDAPYYEGASVRQICDELAALLNTMTEADRYAMVAYHDGILAAPM